MKKSILLFAFLMVVHSVLPQSYPVKVEAYGKTHWNLMNTSSNRLFVEIPQKSDYLDGVDFHFEKNDLESTDQIVFVYRYEDYFRKRSKLITTYTFYLRILEQRSDQIRRTFNKSMDVADKLLKAKQIADYLDDKKDDSTATAADILGHMHEAQSLLDPDGDLWVHIFTGEERENERQARLDFNVHEQFYRNYKNPTRIQEPIIDQFKRHPYYRNVSPSVILDISLIVGKTKLDENWGRGVGAIAFSTSLSLAITPEINHSKYTKTRLYFQGAYNRMVFSLNDENTYYVNNLHDTGLSNGELSQIKPENNLNLVLKQLSAGVSIGTVAKVARFDVGAGYSFHRSAHLFFHEQTDYGFAPDKPKFETDIKQSNNFSKNPYLQFGISKATPKWSPWLSRQGFLGAEVLYQRINLNSERGVGIFNEASEDIGLTFAQNRNVLFYKIKVGLVF